MNYKETYIKMRNSQKIDNNWLWSYYKSEGGELNNPQEFLEHFYYIIRTVNMDGNILQQKTPRDLSQLFNEMDIKFELTTLWGKDGFIKVVG